MGVSCLDQPDCFRQNLNLMGISFKKMLDGQADSVYIVRVTSPETQNPSFEWTDTTFVTNISLPIDYLSKENTTTFYITRAVDGQLQPAEILQVGYSSKTQFVSEDCGERFIVSGLNIIQAGYDSIKLVSSDLSNPAHTNIVIYRCPEPNYMKVSFRQYYMDFALSQPDPRFISSITTDNINIPYGKIGVSSVRLPLNENATTSNFTFLFSDGSKDTLNVSYTISKKTIFRICGEQQSYKLDTSNVKTSFKKALQIFKIRRDILFDPPLTNIEITRCPQNNLINMLFKRISSFGGSAFRDSVRLTSVTADYPTGNLLAGITGKVTEITLPLNPSNNSTKFYFEFKLDSASVIKKDTLELSYTFDSPVTYHSECGPLTPITALQISNTTFNSQTKVDDPNVKFPVVSNIEIIQ